MFQLVIRGEKEPETGKESPKQGSRARNRGGGEHETEDKSVRIVGDIKDGDVEYDNCDVKEVDC